MILKNRRGSAETSECPSGRPCPNVGHARVSPPSSFESIPVDILLSHSNKLRRNNQLQIDIERRD